MRRSAIDVARRFGVGGALALALVVGVAPVPAGAAPQECSCRITDQDERTHADVVFKGTLEGTTSSVSTDRNGVVHESGLVHRFIPTSVYDGTVYNPQYVVEPADTDKACRVAWEGPGPYLVFAEVPSDAEKTKYGLNDADLLLEPCGGTRPIDADDEPSFGPGTPVASDDESVTAAKDVPAEPEDSDPEFPLPGFRYLLELLDGLFAYLGNDDDEDTPLEQLLGQLQGDDEDSPLESLLGQLNDDDDDSLLGLGGLVQQLLALLGLAEDPDDDGGLLLIDPALLQKQLDGLGLPDLAALQEQLKDLQKGPGGDDGDGLSLLDPGSLGGIGTPPPPGSAAS